MGAGVGGWGGGAGGVSKEETQRRPAPQFLRSMYLSPFRGSKKSQSHSSSGASLLVFLKEHPTSSNGCHTPCKALCGQGRQ